MKLPLSLLKKFVELPTQNITDLRHLLDDLGLEVKDIETNANDTVFNIETLANRGDHVSVLGMAREFCGRFLTDLKKQPTEEKLPSKDISFKICKNTALCFRYAALELSFVSKPETTAEVAAYLGDAAGNHPVVDILNYTALELGQPMHAFDKSKLEGEIIIDLSIQEEKITGLDNKEYKIPKGSLLIKDSKKIIAAAGVIGCANSMVDENTKEVIIESASFDPVTIRKTAKAMGLSTDASYIFERGCDLQQAVNALHRVLYLTKSFCKPAGFSLKEDKSIKPDQISISFDQIKKQLNLQKLEIGQLISHLSHLGFETVADKNQVLNVSIPSWRYWDVSNENDIIEEAARVISLNKIKLELPALSYEAAELNPIENLYQKIESSLTGNGFIEIITKGFYSSAEAEIINELDPGLCKLHVKLKNAVDSNYSHLKVTNIIHFAKIAEQNLRKGVQSIKIYEFSRIFLNQQQENNPYKYERDVLSFAAYGRWNENEWQKPESREAMLASFKGVVESVLKSTGNQLVTQESAVPLMHPGCQAALYADGKYCGFFGVIHPLIKERLDLKSDLLYCEYDAGVLAELIRTNSYTEASEFPAIKRDLTLKLPLNSQAGSIINFISGLKTDNLQSTIIHDTFRKPDEDFRRVTFRMTFQNSERTLESREIDAAMQNIISFLAEKHSLHMA